MSPSKPSGALDDRRQFFVEAHMAVKAGLITPAEVVTIGRLGHRKQWAWARHLRDLREILAERKAR